MENTRPESIKAVLGSTVAIVGAGNFCRAFLEFLFEKNPSESIPEILGVADADENALGIQYAKEKTIFNTRDYNQLYGLQNLETILELTRGYAVAENIRKTKPDHIRLIDHIEFKAIWEQLQVEHVRRTTVDGLNRIESLPDGIKDLLDRAYNQISAIVENGNKRAQKIELELIEQERAKSQIVEGSTIPTFVVNQDHIVTHWNRAMEKFSGTNAEQMVGSRKQAIPFWGKERPTMADVILDQTEETEIEKLYGQRWRKSTLIDGAYEAEVFLPSLGDFGTWCWFTAAPIKGPDGTIVGAIETIWDKTEEKLAEEERERYTETLATLVAVYVALSAPMDLDTRINETIQKIKEFLSADSICIFLKGDDGTFQPKYCYGEPIDVCGSDSEQERKNIEKVVSTAKLTVFEKLGPENGKTEAGDFESGYRSLAYVPINAKEERDFGVIRIGSKTFGHFTEEQINVLDLIGNRIGIAFENARLQEQYIKSEEKYRSLFNNDPNPIFIVDSEDHKILDINHRTEASYGYSRNELIGYPFLSLGDKEDVEIRNGLEKLSIGKSVLFSKKRHYKKNGQTVYVNISVSHGQYGENRVLIATTTDISESVEKETQLIQAGKMTTLGVMAAGMAHEINQPLNVIQVCADYFQKMVKRGQSVKDEDLKTMAEEIIANVERAAGVIKHVRDFARLSEVVKHRVNINDPIRDVFKILGHQLKVHEIELDLELMSDIPYIMADHNRLEQVFINLVTNATDAMDEKAGKPEFEGTDKRLTVRSFVENGWIVVEVTDTGTGIPKEAQDKIFEPFFTTKETGKGTGLGVSISYGIVKDYEGHIELNSETGKGTTFLLKFPQAPQE